MAEKMFLLIICGIMCIHQILGEESSDHLVRRKRVINLEPGGDVALVNGVAPFVVNIRIGSNKRNIAVGAILSKHTVVTVAEHIQHLNVSEIQILVGSSIYFRGIHHDVITKNPHFGIILLTVVPAIVFDGKTDPIQLHEGPLLTGMPVTIFGWGCNPTSPRGTNHLDRLRSITVPIMNHGDCVNIYRNYMFISDNEMCTYDENKRCGHTDSGAPLVVDDKLAGLHLWSAPISGRMGPDVFVVLQSLQYSSWVRNNIIHNVVYMRGSK